MHSRTLCPHLAAKQCVRTARVCLCCDNAAACFCTHCFQHKPYHVLCSERVSKEVNLSMGCSLLHLCLMSPFTRLSCVAVWPKIPKLFGLGCHGLSPACSAQMPWTISLALWRLFGFRQAATCLPLGSGWADQTHLCPCALLCVSVCRGKQICWNSAKWVATCCWEVRQSRIGIIFKK